ncbi:hypothetical protein JSE7799_00146 [Jannaschia seosinensis]|uniref:Transposase DDE domain-containing protein n=1 Tax=Jannaschia seosinensis TaxID=313367 RepID=A0A0M7B643_9RHOB|nr:hypothetical protein JSE7799_00146 [Jannaschia seosinensis]
MNWESAPAGRPGRQRTSGDAARQVCLTVKVLLGMPLRPTPFGKPHRREPVALGGLDWTVPDFSTLSGRRKTLAVKISRRAQGPAASADFLSGQCYAMPCRAVGSTGIEVEGENGRYARKHGGPKRRIRHGRSDLGRGMAHGARSLSGSIRKRWRFGPSRVSGRTPTVRESPRTRTGAMSAMVGRAAPPLRARRERPARSSQPDPGGPGDRERYRGRCLRRPQMPRCPCRPWPSDPHPTPQEHEAVERVTAGAAAGNVAPRASKHLGRAIWRHRNGHNRRCRAGG